MRPFFMLIVLAVFARAHPNHQLEIISTAPAKDPLADVLPLGNGHAGALLLGGVAEDVLTMTDKSLWSGGPEARGAFQVLGKLRVITGHDPAKARTFTRRLDLQTATAEVTYRHASTRHRREYFFSYPDRALVGLFRSLGRAEEPLWLRWEIPHPVEFSFDAQRSRLTARGHLVDNHLDFEMAMEVRAKGGRVTAKQGEVKIEGASEVLVLVSTATSYALAYPAYRTASFTGQAAAALDKIKADDARTLTERHLEDFQQLFHAMYISIDGPMQTQLTTERRLELYRQRPDDDLGLEELFFQYGRYLLIAASRPGALPAHRRGVWHFPPANGIDNEYRADGPLPQTYAPAEATHLGECQAPLVDFLADLAVAGAKTAKELGQEGWEASTKLDPYGSANLLADKQQPPTAGAWLAPGLWDRYDFGGRAGWKEKCWPALEGAARFHRAEAAGQSALWNSARLAALAVEPTSEWAKRAPLPTASTPAPPTLADLRARLGTTQANLFFQNQDIAANLEYTAGVCDMLLDSRQGVLRFLPALPREWPDGSVTGMMARGGHEVAFAWQNGRFLEGYVTSLHGGECRVAAGLPLEAYRAEDQPAQLRDVGEGMAMLHLQPGEQVTLRAKEPSP